MRRERHDPLTGLPHIAADLIHVFKAGEDPPEITIVQSSHLHAGQSDVLYQSHATRRPQQLPNLPDLPMIVRTDPRTLLKILV
jgi:hypothetical protein